MAKGGKGLARAPKKPQRSCGQTGVQGVGRGRPELAARINVADLLQRAGLAASKGEARRLIRSPFPRAASATCGCGWFGVAESTRGPSAGCRIVLLG